MFILYNHFNGQDYKKNANPTLHYQTHILAQAKSNPYLLMEGRAAARLFLSWSPEEIRKVWQKPMHNSFSNPNRLRFLYHDIEITVNMNNGRIIQISYFTRHAQEKWSTALGVNASLLTGLSTEEAMSALVAHYQKQKVIVEYVRYKEIIEFTSLGIRYHFRKNKLLQIDVFADSVLQISLPKIYQDT